MATWSDETNETNEIKVTIIHRFTNEEDGIEGRVWTRDDDGQVGAGLCDLDAEKDQDERYGGMMGITLYPEGRMDEAMAYAAKLSGILSQ